MAWDDVTVLALWRLTAILAAYFAAGLVKGTTGLGFSTSCLPMLVFAVGLKPALGLVLVPSLASNVLVMRDAGGFRQSVRDYWPLFATLLPGLVLGLWVLDGLDQQTAAAVLGAVLMAYGAWGLYRNPRFVDGPAALRWRPLVGLVTGFVNALAILIFMAQLPELIDVPYAVYVMAA
ncbi:MAG: TSUP family transporter, partial [Rhodospirillales bacterium]